MGKSTTTSLLLFILGFGGFMFTRLSPLVPLIPVAILIAPIFILRFIRIQSATRGILLTLLGFLLSFNIALWGLFQFDNPSVVNIYSLVRSSMLAIVWFLPFMIDRWIYPKFKGFGMVSTITFPMVATAIFFLSSLDGPFDDGGGTLSSFSFGSLTFLQAHSLFGVWTFVFLYSWLFALVNYCWEEGFGWKAIQKPVTIYLGLVVVIYAYGFAKKSFWSSTDGEKVKVAAAVLIPEDGRAVRMERIFNEQVTSPFAETTARINRLVQKSARNGARIVSFQEFAMTIDQHSVEELVQEYARIADRNDVYLSVTFAYFGKEEKGENKHLFIGPDGEILLDYAKRYLMGYGNFGETSVFRKGAEVIQSVETPYGRIGLSICRDMGFPSYLRQAARADVDIMLSPSYDWPKSPGPWYLLSTIENGFSFVRPTYNGYSYAADYHGEVINYMHSDETDEGIMYAQVPTQGIDTLYPVVGDILGWICLIGLLPLIVYRPAKREKNELA